jgi:hypothetical protein
VLAVVATGNREPVYSLTVEGVHEFLANGLVVANTDAAMYGWRQCHNYLDVPAPLPKTQAEILNEMYGTHEREDEFFEPKQYWEEGSKWSG